MKNNDIITKIAICFVLVPIVLIVLPYLISPIISEKYGQMTVDLIIFLVAIVLSQNIWHIKISFLSLKKPLSQLCQLIPSILFLLFTRFSILSSMSFRLIDARIILTVLFIALAEESVYRGLLIPLSLVFTKNKQYTAIVISGVGFALAHLVNIVNSPWSIVMLQMLIVFASGLLWGTLYLKTNNLSLTIMLHFLDDLPLFLMKETSELVTPTRPQLISAIMAYLIVVGIIGIITFLQVEGLHLWKLKK